MTKQEELEAIESILAGDKDAYRLLVERYNQGLRYYLVGMLGDQDVADDIAQDAFIRAYDKLSQYNPKFAFSTWLYRIASNLALQHLKKQKTANLDDYIDIIPDDSPSIEEQLDRTATKEEVKSAVMSLPDNYRQVVSLYYWQGMSYEQIAEVVERPIGTVRTWLHRAKDDLRKELYG